MISDIHLQFSEKVKCKLWLIVLSKIIFKALSWFVKFFNVVCEIHETRIHIEYCKGGYYILYILGDIKVGVCRAFGISKWEIMKMNKKGELANKVTIVQSWLTKDFSTKRPWIFRRMNLASNSNWKFQW